MSDIEDDIENIKELVQGSKDYGEYENNKYFEAMENILSDYTRQKQINEEHQKINGGLREKVKELECENRENKEKYLALLISQFPDTTGTYKKYKKELEELLQESEDK